MDFTFSRLCGPSGAIRSSQFPFCQPGSKHGRVTAWIPALIAAQALGLAARGQETFDPGLPPTLASPRIPGPAATESTRRTPGSDYFLGGQFQGATGPSGGDRGYNFKVGNLTGSFTAAASLTYSDNVLLTGSGAGDSGDLPIIPSVGMNLYYPITKYSELDVSFGVGYVFYVDHSELNRVTASIVPRSSLNYRFVVGDVLVTLYNSATFPSKIGRAHD